MSSALCLCVIILIIIIVVVFFASRKERFTTFTTAATPLSLSVIDELSGSFGRICSLSAELGDGNRGLKAITDRLVNVFNITRVKRTPPSYANFAALYNGLVCNDSLLDDAASAYERTGDRLGDCHDKKILYSISREIRNIRRSIHKLGASLDME